MPRPSSTAAALAGAGALLTPGFIDIHGHGGGGFSYDDGPDAIRVARALHRAHGTTRAVVSLVTAPLETLERRVAMIADLIETDPDILGSHLEGPFLDPGHKGAHDLSLLRDPSLAAVERLLAAGRGTVRQVTLAPELPGGHDAIRAIVAAGAAAAVGHTDADLDATRAAFDAGATILTHAFNAMPPLHHRDPGPVGAAASDPRVTLEVIADGVHLHPEIVRLAFLAAPGRVALVTDAMAAAGAADGRYELGSLEVDVVDGIARLADGGAIAGSTLTQDAALRFSVAAECRSSTPSAPSPSFPRARSGGTTSARSRRRRSPMPCCCRRTSTSAACGSAAHPPERAAIRGCTGVGRRGVRPLHPPDATAAPPQESRDRRFLPRDLSGPGSPLEEFG